MCTNGRADRVYKSYYYFENVKTINTNLFTSCVIINKTILATLCFTNGTDEASVVPKTIMTGIIFGEEPGSTWLEYMVGVHGLSKWLENMAWVHGLST